MFQEGIKTSPHSLLKLFNPICFSTLDENNNICKIRFIYECIAFEGRSFQFANKNKISTTIMVFCMDNFIYVTNKIVFISTKTFINYYNLF